MTIGSCVLMADWQSIPFDECTNFSPFHHPSLIDDYNFTKGSKQFSKRSQCHPLVEVRSNFLNGFEVDSWSKLSLSSGYEMTLPLAESNKFVCKSANTCSDMCNKYYKNESSTICLKYIVNWKGCGSLIDGTQMHFSSDRVNYSESFLCSSPISAISFCVILNTSHNQSQVVETQAMNLPSEIFSIARNKCVAANTTWNDCYWNPQSIVTGKLCEDCQPICRSKSHSLTFVQFLLGSALLLVSIPIAWIPVAALISNRVSTNAQVLYKILVLHLSHIPHS